MALDAFISYSHADEKALERLHKHLAMLRRDKTLNAWSDHKVLPGEKFGDKISEKLARSGLFLALLSPDYLDSNYCYEKEFQQAQQLAAADKIRIIPIILEPCDWLASPFAEYKALPKDGKPISEWANQNNAYLNVVTGLREVAESLGTPQTGEAGGEARQSARRLRIRQDFDAIQRSEFADQAFQAMCDYFEGSCRELNEVGDTNLKAKFEKMDANAFTCTVVNRGRRGGSEAHITVRNCKGRVPFGDINYVFERYADGNSSNGVIRVDADDYNLFLRMNRYGQGEESKFSFQQAAEALWLEFVKNAGIEYE
jgi:TIR domain